MPVPAMADVSDAQKSPAHNLPEYTLKEVALHNRKDDNWIVIHGQGKSHDPQDSIELELRSFHLLRLASVRCDKIPTRSSRRRRCSG
jgi:hypothetical protein